MGKFLKKYYDKFTETFKSVDLFGKEISLNFNDEEVYTTACGGFFTLIFISVLLFFFWG